MRNALVLSFILTSLMSWTMFVTGCTKTLNPVIPFSGTSPTPTSSVTGTVTFTPTVTAPVITPTPSTFRDFDDFWCNNVWTSETWGYYAIRGGSAQPVSTGLDTTNYWHWSPVPEGNSSATYTPESFSVTISSFGTGTGVTQGYCDFALDSLYPDGNSAINGNPVPLTSAGTITDFDMQCFCPMGGPVTIEFIQLFSPASANKLQTTNINVSIPNNGAWTDVNVPLANFINVSGSLTDLETAGIGEVQIQVTGPATTATCVLDIGSIVFY